MHPAVQSDGQKLLSHNNHSPNRFVQTHRFTYVQVIKFI